MHESALEVEMIARNRIHERTTRERVPVRSPRPRRRTTVARGLRRVADLLDD